MDLTKLYKDAERTMMRDVYPELCAMMQEKKRDVIGIDIPQFANTKIYSNGDMILWIDNPLYNENDKILAEVHREVYDVPAKDWITIGNILTDRECPRYLRVMQMGTVYTYIQFCEKILEITMELRNEGNRLKKFINDADAFASSKPRIVLTEKVL